MEFYAAPVSKVIEEFSKLPGIGPKSAMRIAFYLLSRSDEEVEALASAISDLKKKIRFCGVCFNLSEGELCSICSDPERKESLICVVEEPRDVTAVERTGLFKGRYHVLGGAISPIDGVGPENLRIEELKKRVEKGGVEEVIIATNPDATGDATAFYIARLLKPLGVKITRIASGLPVGGEVEHADEVTLARALGGRVPME